MKSAYVMMAVLLAATLGFSEDKTVVVNMVDLVRFHPNRERDRKLMNDTEKEFQEKLDKRRDRFEQLRADYEKAAKEARNPALSDKARTEAETKATRHREVLAEADRDTRMEVQKLQRELAELDSRLLRQVTGEIREVVTKYAKDNRCTFVLDATTLAYCDPKMDVTDDVLKLMGVNPELRKKPQVEAEKKAVTGK